MDDLVALVEFMLGLLSVLALLVLAARQLNLPYPILLVVGGLALGFLPGVPRVELAPSLVFLLFLPPILYEEAKESSTTWTWSGCATSATWRSGSSRVRSDRMREPLTIAVAQPLCVPYDVEMNALTHAATVRSARTRVIVFPELSLTGYELDAPAITAGDPRLAPIIEACAETGSLALVGAPVLGAAGGAHIAMIAIDGDSAAIAYRKMWLGGVESERFTPGGKPAVLDVDGWRLGLAVCKDTGVPQHAADTADLGIDAYVAGVLESVEDAVRQDERARRVASEHRVWVAVASFAGSTGGGYSRAAGRSAIWGPDGILVARAGAETGAVARATLFRTPESQVTRP